MKFAIPFFKKQPVEKKAEASAKPASPDHGPSLTALPEVEKKPFVVPESADAMPSFSQPVELAQLASTPEQAAPTVSTTTATAEPPTPEGASAATAEKVLTAEKALSAAETPKQMESMLMSAEDIIAAYKIFLKRHPETMDVIQPRVGLTGDRVLVDFLSSSEFTSRPEAVNLIFALAKKLLDEQKAKTTQEASAAVATSATQDPK